MDAKSKQEMMSYYDGRAEEYDDIYLGRGPAIPDPEAYKVDAARISQMVAAFGRGHLIDIGCGTGFWLPFYARNCTRITLNDRSEKMLLQCKNRVRELPALEGRCRFVQGDFFDLAFADLFDSALVGFLISHLCLEQEEVFFTKLKTILRPNAELMLIDSAWSSRRSQFRSKEGTQVRALRDGRVFTIYKRYLDQSDIEETFAKYCFGVESCYTGDVFLATIGRSRASK